MGHNLLTCRLSLSYQRLSFVEVSLVVAGTPKFGTSKKAFRTQALREFRNLFH